MYYNIHVHDKLKVSVDVQLENITILPAHYNKIIANNIHIFGKITSYLSSKLPKLIIDCQS